MKQNEQRVLGWIALSEGGYVNHPDDPGGATDRGITQKVYSAYLKERGMPDKPVRGISKQVAEDIIVLQYFTPVRFNSLPSGLDYAVVDYAVNSGVSKAVKDLQRTLGVTPVDGIVGAVTLSAMANMSQQEVVDTIEAYCVRRMAFLRTLRTWKTFRNGWTTRVMGKTWGSQPGDIGVIDRAVELAKSKEIIPGPVPVANSEARAMPEVPVDTTTSEIFGGGVMAAAASALAAMGSLHPTVQAGALALIAIGGLLLYRAHQQRKVREAQE